VALNFKILKNTIMSQSLFYFITAVCSIAVTVAIVAKMLPRGLFRSNDRHLDRLDRDIMLLSNNIEALHEQVDSLEAGFTSNSDRIDRLHNNVSNNYMAVPSQIAATLKEFGFVVPEKKGI